MNAMLGFVKVRDGVVAEPVTVSAYPRTKSSVGLLCSDAAALIDAGVGVNFSEEAAVHALRTISAFEHKRLAPFASCAEPNMDLWQVMFDPAARKMTRTSALTPPEFIGVCCISWIYDQLLKNRRPAVYTADANLLHCLKVREKFKPLRRRQLRGLVCALTEKQLLTLNMQLLSFLDKMVAMMASQPDVNGHISFCE